MSDDRPTRDERVTTIVTLVMGLHLMVPQPWRKHAASVMLAISGLLPSYLDAEYCAGYRDAMEGDAPQPLDPNPQPVVVEADAVEREQQTIEQLEQRAEGMLAAMTDDPPKVFH